MVDLKNQIERVEESLKKRNSTLNIDEIRKIRERYVKNRIYLDSLYNKMKNLSKSVKSREEAEKISEEARELKIETKRAEEEFEESERVFEEIVTKLPNVLAPEVPYGKDSDDNVEVKRKGEIVFHKHHYEMNIFEECSDICGSRFVILKDKFAKLERALGSFMMSFLEEKGFVEFSVPFIMKTEGFKLSGHIKDKENMFKVEDDQYLIPTGEAVLVNIPRFKKFNEDDLPIKLCAMTDCFRSEAGSAGKDTRGMIRVHQFKKCEMVCFTTADKSYKLLEEMLDVSCKMLEALGIPYRVVLLCSGDTGTGSSKTYDIEVPIGGTWREIASISNCEEFQTRRSKIKLGKTNEFLHSLNGSALPLGRTLVTILEVCFDQNRNVVKIPSVLHKYLSFTEIEIE